MARMHHPANRPRLAITLGDPAGIGPEVVAKALGEPIVNELCCPVVVGDRRSLERAPGGSQSRAALDAVSIVDVPAAAPGDIVVGQVSAAAGAAALAAVEAAVRLATAGEVDAIVTAPLNKEALRLAGCPFPGQTELLAALTGTPKTWMLLLAGPLRIIHVSTHVPLQEAIRQVQTARVRETIGALHQALTDLGHASPRLAVAGLNPHAGEHGLFGEEDEREIRPAVQACAAAGWQVTGPEPPDTVFFRAARGEFDGVVAMYHDQGHIPAKLLGFDVGVNVSIGLPIIRASVDHGTAFDIAGQGIASHRSLVAAIETAVQLARVRRARDAAPHPPGRAGQAAGKDV